MADTRRIKRILLRLALVALAVGAVIAIAAIVTGRLDRAEAQILLTDVVVLVYSLFALSVATVATRNPLLAAAGWVCCACGTLLALVAIWVWSNDAPDLYRVMGISFVGAFTLAHDSLLVSRRRESDGPPVRAISAATVAIVSALGILVALAITGIPDRSTPWYLRLLGVIGVLDLLGTVALPIARKIESTIPRPD